MRLLLPLLMTVPLALAGAPLAASQPITGRWLTDSKDGIIHIARCGETLCGRLQRSLVPIEPPGTDIKNPDPALRERRILGLAVLTGLRLEDGKWQGQAYDPKTGRSYRAVVERVSNEALKVTGCLAIFCRTVTWTRAN
ncbi:DUF2147 domain-containing protein [Sphingomonas changnyeongensis]|uniref:DUF2147 domain-containing protein n=1 Tax=Sphingomonas changnyeongensis TaxID=2698679 RepID=A0A7Z2NUV2_9SPHN|nr:DUF2147 domain-containing protein [Sphingomonas changnyeongensis]QHL89800.1 DUF2147 domain-containing protein [Sphingomonas changnyeongensis]